MIYFTSLVLLILVIVVIIITIELRKNTRIVAILIPLFVLSIGFSWATLNYIKGRPKEGFPDTYSILLSAIIIKPSIFLTVSEHNEVKLYQIPWSEKNGNTADDAIRMMKSGKIIKLVKADDNSGRPVLNITEFDFSNVMSKDKN